MDYFEFTNNGTISTTTATSTNLTLADNSNNSFSLRAKDIAGNWSTSNTVTAEVSLMPVVINEVAWAGNSTTYSADEWIELYNRTNLPVNLNNFILYSKTDLTPYVNLSGQIVSNGYYLLERTNDTTISNIAADQIYTGDLVNFGENIALVYKPTGQATTTIDEIPYDFNWYAGSDFSYYSMERYDPDIAGTSASNWGTNNAPIINGKNAGGGNVYGTPKARNSLNYLINKGNGVYSSLTLSASGSPYFVNGVQSVTSSSTLTIEPGVVIKFNAINKSGLQFINGGKLSAVGSSANPIIFTSFYDDSYGGDTNGSVGSTSPSYGDWYGVRIDSPGTESTISRALFRYGGWYYSGGGWTDSKANLYIANSSASISDSIFEYARVYGAKLSNASSTLAGNTFRYNNNGVEGASAGLSSELGKLALNSNIFSNNKRGLYVVSSNFDSSSSFNSNTFTSNTGEAVYSSGRLGSYTNNYGSGNGVDAIYISGTITQNGATTTLAVNSLPYLLNGSVTVAAGSTLAVNSGVALKGWFNNSTSYLNVYGNLVVSGTNFSDIVFGSMFSSPAKGNWGGVRLYSGSYSSISGATFEYANTALTYNSSPISLANVKFNENNLGCFADSASLSYPVSASGVTFTNNTATTSPGGLW